VTKDRADFFRVDRNADHEDPADGDLDAVAAAKAGYKHFMLKEIHEQPRAINRHAPRPRRAHVRARDLRQGRAA
jgi:glucosamine 6-phosphate synthetase-like amidotransferase/phosphosugar isomerase protein